MKNPQTLAGWHPMRGREGGKEEEEKEWEKMGAE